MDPNGSWPGGHDLVCFFGGRVAGGSKQPAISEYRSMGIRLYSRLAPQIITKQPLKKTWPGNRKDPRMTSFIELHGLAWSTF